MQTFNLYGTPITANTRFDFWRLAANEKWETGTFKAIDRFVKPNTYFIDIGAWIGVFSIYAASKGAKVLPIEPDEVAVKELIQNFELNGLFYDICEAAISANDGIAELNSMNNGFGNSESSLVDRGTIAGIHQVPTMKLESLIKSYGINPKSISLIKADCEGGEVDIITSSKEWLTEHKPNIHLSIHPAWIKQEGIDAISEVIFPIYNVESDTGTHCTKENFNEVIQSHQHAFILTAKN